MRVGIDLDGVCYDFVGALTRFARVLYPDADFPHPTGWDFFKDQWGWTTEQYLRVFGAGVLEGNIFWRGAPSEGCVDALNELRELGHEVVIVTHRDHPEPEVAKAMRRATLYWLQNHDIPVDGILFKGVKTNTGIDVLVDDAPHNIKAAWDADETVLAFDQPWNRDVDLPVLRAYSWTDVVSAVESLDRFYRDIEERVGDFPGVGRRSGW